MVVRIRTRSPNARIVALNMINLAGAPYVARWQLEPGDHVLFAENAAGTRSEPVRFAVR